MFGRNPLRHTRLGQLFASWAPRCDELCDHCPASFISPGIDLTEEPGCIMAAFVPALMEIIAEIGDLLSATAGWLTFWKFATAQPTANSLAFDVQRSADRLLRIALLAQVY